MLEICFPLFSFSRDRIYCLGSLVLLIEFSYVTWKFIFTLCNNIKEQQVSKKKVWPLPIYTLNANSDKLGQMKTANTCPISVKSGQDASRPGGWDLQQHSRTKDGDLPFLWPMRLELLQYLPSKEMHFHFSLYLNMSIPAMNKHLGPTGIINITKVWNSYWWTISLWHRRKKEDWVRTAVVPLPNGTG